MHSCSLLPTLARPACPVPGVSPLAEAGVQEGGTQGGHHHDKTASSFFLQDLRQTREQVRFLTTLTSIIEAFQKTGDVFEGSWRDRTLSLNQTLKDTEKRGAAEAAGRCGDQELLK